MKYNQSALLLIFVMFGMSACSDSGANFEEAQPAEATFASIQVNVLNRSCAISGCHNGTESPNLNEGVAYNNIVNRASGQRNFNLIEPGNPNSSYLYLKLVGGNISGGIMPRGQSRLSAAVTDSIRAWIENGALNN
mgnify:CR=1 FL=1